MTPIPVLFIHSIPYSLLLFLSGMVTMVVILMLLYAYGYLEFLSQKECREWVKKLLTKNKT